MLEVKGQLNALGVAQQIKASGASTASAITYDNTSSGLTADDVQEAIDELASSSGGGDFFVFTNTEAKVGSFLGVDAYAIGYDLGSDVSVANNAWETFDITTTAVKFLQVFGVSSQGNYTPLQAYKDGQKISVKACSQRTESVRYLGVIYSKS